VKRRDLLIAAAVSGSACSKRSVEARIPLEKSTVAVIKASSYETELLSLLEAGMREAWPEAPALVRGKVVLLKPNLVEFDQNTCINTDPRLVLACRELFLKIGAKSVLIAEGPGHRRDTWDLADQAGYRKVVPGFDDSFVDLNLDDVRSVRAFGNSMDLFLPETILDVDLVVSVAKMKTHHWAAATLSMKNFFGIVPGAIYGWPKNILHYQGIDQSIVELNRIVRHTFAIVDGIVAMEGNGPIQGTPVNAGLVVMGKDVAAVDSTCARLMKLDPLKIKYLKESAALRLPGLGTIEEAQIEQRGETIASLSRPFAVIDDFVGLRLV
jgi:uncharacterized protein (DUF362 family)